MTDSFNFNAPQYVDFTSSQDLEFSGYGEDYFDMDHEVILNCKEEIVETENVETIEIESTISEVSTPKHEIISISSEVSSTINDTTYSDSTYSTPKSKSDDQEEYIEIKNEVYDDEDKENALPLRRSMSAGNIYILMPQEEEIQNCYNIQENLCEAVKAIELCNSGSKKKKNHNIFSKEILSAKPNIILGNQRHSTFTKPRSNYGSTDKLNLTSFSTQSLKRKMSAEELGPHKYISNAEYVNKYHFRTPDRFHSKPKGNRLIPTKHEELHCTIPQSPMLTTKTRVRPVYYTPLEEKEKREVDEMKKYKIKAHPMNYKILNAPNLVKVEKKPITKLEPFNITEKVKKPPSPMKAEVFEFHARPVPKSNATTHPIIKQSVLPRTKPITPSFMRLRKMKQTQVPTVDENTNDNKVSVKKINAHHNGVQMNMKPLSKTKVVPFSFEERDKKILEKKEEKVRKFIEEEKKKAEFHAKPVPASIGIGPVQSRFNQSGDKSRFKSNESLDRTETDHSFKARPASVVHKKPFIPKKAENSATIPCEFALRSEMRAKEREEYVMKIKEREEEIEKLRREQEETKRQLEMVEVAQIRKEIVHKAQPVRKYKEFELHKSTKPLTAPESPCLSKRRNNTD